MPASPSPLFDHLEELLRRLRKGGRWGLFLDYDGTLSPIVSRPEAARLPAKTRALLERLARHPRFYLALVSGRTAADLKARVGMEGLVLAGTHGLELEEGGERTVHPDAEGAREVMARLWAALERALRGVPGVLVEDKTFTVAVHYRRVAAGRREMVCSRALEVAAPFERAGEVARLEGKLVVEFRPPGGWDKGRALLWLRERAAARGGEPLAGVFYLGDDTTDEDAFAALGPGDVGILVAASPRASRARFRVRSPGEVARLLEALAEVPHA